MFQFESGSWVQLGHDINGDRFTGDQGDRFGSSVFLSADGNRVAIGAIWNDGNGNFFCVSEL